MKSYAPSKTYEELFQKIILQTLMEVPWLVLCPLFFLWKGWGKSKVKPNPHGWDNEPNVRKTSRRIGKVLLKIHVQKMNSLKDLISTYTSPLKARQAFSKEAKDTKMKKKIPFA